MKVLMLSIDAAIAQSGSRSFNRMKELSDLVDELFIIVFKKGSQVKIKDGKLKIWSTPYVGRWRSLMWAYGFGKKLCLEHEVQVVTAQDPYYLGLVGLSLARKFKLGLEVQVHGWEKYFGLRKIVAKYVIPKAQAIRVVSKRLEDQLVDKFSVKKEKIICLPIYTRIKRPEDSSRDMNTNGKFIFITISRLVGVKNIEMQVRALGKILESFPNTALWVIGHGPEREKLDKMVSDLGLREDVNFFDWQSDVSKFYNSADAFVLTSNSEGWAMVVIEAASFGLPIIMTDVGCAEEVIKDGESGLVIPVGDEDALVGAMKRLIEDPSMAKRLGEGASRAIQQLSSKEELLSRYRKSWQIAIENNQRGNGR